MHRDIKHFAKQLSGSLLDFGCGNKPYLHLFSVNKYVGLDIENPGHKHDTEPVDVFYDGRNIPFANQSFDSFFSSQVFEHVFDLPHSLSELHRVLKPGGKGLILVPFVWDEHEVPFDFARYSQFGIKHLLQNAGFEILSQKQDAHFAQVIAQLLSYYVFRLTETKHKYLNIVLAMVFIFPINLIGVLLSNFLPKVRTLYFNNVILVSKPS